MKNIRRWTEDSQLFAVSVAVFVCAWFLLFALVDAAGAQSEPSAAAKIEEVVEIVGKEALAELDELCTMRARLVRAVPLIREGRVVADFLVEFVYDVARVRYTLIRYSSDFSTSECVAIVLRVRPGKVVALFKSEADKTDFGTGATEDKKFLEQQQNKKRERSKRIEI